MLMLMLAAVLVKQVAWVFWIPAGAITSEVDHYRAAETIRLAGRFVRDHASHTEKDVSLLEDYARFRDDRLPSRSVADRRSFEHALESSAADPVLVRNQGKSRASGNAPGYYVLLGRCQALLDQADVRWRWMLLRLLNTTFLLAAVWFTYVGGRVFFPNHSVPARAGAIAMGFGPWASFGGSLLGPGPLAAALWATWLWQVGSAIRKQTQWSLLWLALISFALSSLGVGGFLAAMCTVGVALFMMQRRRPAQVLPYTLACLLALVCVAFWIYRLTRADSASWSVPATWSDVAFGSPGFVLFQPPGWIWALNAVIGALVLGGVIVALVQRSVEWWTIAVALGLVLAFFAFRSVLAGHASGLLSVSPAVGLLVGAGVLGISRKLWYSVTVMAGVLVISDLGLLVWWIQRALS